MKAISLWQPWASLMAVGAKRNETRSWPTSHRGDLAICAAKHWDDDCAACLGEPEFEEALRGKVQKMPFGCVVAVVDLYSCVRSEEVNLKSSVVRPLHKHEHLFGNYGCGRFVWQTRNLRTLLTPVPVKGRQGLFELDAATEKLVRASMGHSDEMLL